MAFRKTLRKIRQNILYAKTPPKITALSLALGIGIALGPFPGFHFFLVFILLKFCRLNNIVLLGGVFLHNPWTMIPIHALGLMVGDLILHGHLASVDTLSAVPWKEFGFLSLFQKQFWDQNGESFLKLLLPFGIGSSLIGVLSGIFSYYTALQFLRRRLPDEFRQSPPSA